ncbi:SDR family NAD(P)-dependent oxidoreductase [Saccharopolyspora sp. NPDC003752]
MGRVDGGIVIVTGGARGMGAEFARKLVAEGARVVLDDQGEELPDELGERAVLHRLDVTLEQQWTDVAVRAEAMFGLVNNAGVVHAEPIEALSEEDLRRMIGVSQ